LNQFTIKAEIKGKTFKQLSIGQTLTVRYLPMRPTFCEVQIN